MSLFQFYMLQLVMSLLYVTALVKGGTRVKPLPLLTECIIWGILAFCLTLEIVPKIPMICRIVYCGI